jgi:hypothetical protein
MGFGDRKRWSSCPVLPEVVRLEVNPEDGREAGTDAFADAIARALARRRELQRLDGPLEDS